MFVDYWNFRLNDGVRTGLPDEPRAPHPDWSAFGPHVTARTAEALGASDLLCFAGLRVYASFAQGDAGFAAWASRNIATVPDVSLMLVPRRVRRAPRCACCRGRVTESPCCGAPMAGTQEKGVDTRLAADMMRLAWDDAYDVAVLVSNDADFVPVVETLAAKGKTIVHAQTGLHGGELVEACATAFALDVGLPRARPSGARPLGLVASAGR